jgi:hypothetical protein
MKEGLFEKDIVSEADGNPRSILGMPSDLRSSMCATEVSWLRQSADCWRARTRQIEQHALAFNALWPVSL